LLNSPDKLDDDITQHTTQNLSDNLTTRPSSASPSQIGPSRSVHHSAIPGRNRGSSSGLKRRLTFPRLFLPLCSLHETGSNRIPERTLQPRFAFCPAGFVWAHPTKCPECSALQILAGLSGLVEAKHWLDWIPHIVELVPRVDDVLSQRLPTNDKGQLHQTDSECIIRATRGPSANHGDPHTSTTVFATLL